MRIVVVDGATLNPGDLSWDAFRAFGEVEVYPQSSSEETLARCAGAEVAITNKVVLDAATLDELPDLRYVGVTATGYNIVDVGAARERGVVVTNVPTYGTASVAQMAFALLLELTQHVGHHSETVREGRWGQTDDFCYWDYPLVELAGLTMGIVGCGRIGQATARIAKAFGMEVIGYDAFPFDAEATGIRSVALDDLFSESDVVSLHCPLMPETEGLVNAARIGLMKPTAFLLNTSRGPLVAAQDLADALNSGRIAGAGLDVLTVEPPKDGNPLIGARNCFVTPHIAWATRSARERLLQATVDNLAAFLAGAPQNVVNA